MSNFKSLQSVLKVPSSFEDEEELYSKMPTKEEELEAYTSTPKWSAEQYKQSITPEHREKLERQQKARERTEEFEKTLSEDMGPFGVLGYHVLKNIAFDERPPSEFEQSGGGVYEGMSPIDFVTPSGIGATAKGIGKAFARPGIRKAVVSEILPAKRFEKIKQALPPSTIEGKVVTPQIAAEERLALPAPATEEPLGLPMPRQELPAPAAKSVEAMPIAEAPIEVPVKTKPKAPSKDPNVPSRFVMPGMYSKAEQLIVDKMGRSATPEQVMGILQGAKPEEVRFLAIKSFLEGKNKVSKDELLKHIQENTPEIKEKVRENIPESKLVEKYLEYKTKAEAPLQSVNLPIIDDIRNSELNNKVREISKNPDSPEYEQLKEEILRLYDSPFTASELENLQKIDEIKKETKGLVKEWKLITDKRELEKENSKIKEDLAKKVSEIVTKIHELQKTERKLIRDILHNANSPVLRKVLVDDFYSDEFDKVVSSADGEQISIIDYLNKFIQKNKKTTVETLQKHQDEYKKRLLKSEKAKKQFEKFLQKNPNIPQLFETRRNWTPIYDDAYDTSPKQKENYKERIYSYSPHKIEIPKSSITELKPFPELYNMQEAFEDVGGPSPNFAYLTPIAKLALERAKANMNPEDFQNYLNNIKLNRVYSHYSSEGPFVLGHRRSSEFVDETGRKHLNVKEYQSDIHQGKTEEGSTVEQEMPIKDWKEFQIKRMLIDAANGDFDNLTWSTGEQQAKLANKLIKTTKLKIKNNGDGSFTLIPGVNNRSIKNLTLQKLNAILGKDVTKELLEKGEIIRTRKDPIKMNFHGVSSYYDAALPNFLSNFGKKFGKKPYKAVIPGTKQEFWTFEMTPEMREFIKKYGFPLFMLPAAMQQETPEEKKDFKNINKMVKDKK